MSTPTNPPKPKFKRKLTPFLCQEMLYDYVVGRLDNERKQAVEEFLADDKESTRLLDGIQVGLEYCDRLALSDVKPEVLKHLSEAESAISLSRRYSSWREWPDAIRWSVTAVLISTLMAGMVAAVPWKNFPALRGLLASVLNVKKPEVIEVARLSRPVQEEQTESVQDQQEGDAAEEGSGDEEMDMADEGAPPDAQAQQQAEAKNPEKAAAPAPISAPTSAPISASMQIPLPVVSTEPVVPAPRRSKGQPAKPAPTAAAESEAAGEAKAAEPTPKESKPKGFVYRAYMTLSNLDDLGPKIAEHITELGGEKAGEVELGWKRGTGRYYHFQMPEENQEKLLEKLRAYGPVRISKDPHPRIMPQGQVRFILWVEAAEQ